MGALLSERLQLLLARIVKDATTVEDVERMLQPLSAADQDAIREVLGTLQRWDAKRTAKRTTRKLRALKRDL